MKPMLAARIVDIDDIKFPCYVSPKLDGVRALVMPDGRLVSRKFIEIPNRHTRKLFGRKDYAGYDGELIVGPANADNALRKTQSATSREEWIPDINFYVFDNFLARGTFKQRLATLEDALRIKVLPQVLCRNKKDLLQFEEKVLKMGFEGVMGRSPDGKYKNGRSTVAEQGMWKLKRFTDGEAVIIGVEEELANTNEQERDRLGRSKRSSHKAGMVPKGRMGSLLVRHLKTGVEFNVGTGFDDADRVWFWEHRHTVVRRKTIVTFKSYLAGVKDKPRSAVYLAIRDKWDL